MRSLRSFALHFYVPLLISGFLIFIVVASPKFVNLKPGLEINGEVSVLGIHVPLPIWLERVWLLRVVLLAASFASLIRAISIDLSKFFPSRLQMDVYFDAKGIERSLKLFTKDELDDVSLAINWKQHISSYDESVRSSLGRLWRPHDHREVPDIADFARDLIHARGSTRFVVKKVGPISYRIVQSSGRLDYDWDVPRKPRRSFCTVFELRETANNHLRPHLWKLLKTRSIVLKPEFKQFFSVEAGGEHAPFDHIVIGLTKALVFPFPQITNTIYLWKLPDETSVPVAYGVYIPDIKDED